MHCFINHSSQQEPALVLAASNPKHKSLPASLFFRPFVLLSAGQVLTPIRWRPTKRNLAIKFTTFHFVFGCKKLKLMRVADTGSELHYVASNAAYQQIYVAYVPFTF